MAGYQTSLAAEFYVLSMLHRRGIDVTLTLSNRKAVNIVVTRGRGDTVTIDVKGTAGTSGWFVDNLAAKGKNHFVVFVTFKGKIQEPDTLPEVYVVPSGRVGRLTSEHPGGKRVVHLATLLHKGGGYRDAWSQLGRGAR